MGTFKDFVDAVVCAVTGHRYRNWYDVDWYCVRCGHIVMSTRDFRPKDRVVVINEK